MTHLKGVSLSTNFAKAKYVRRPLELVHIPFQDAFYNDDKLLRGWGLQFRIKNNLEDIKINAFGEDLPYRDNQASINKKNLDDMGRPQLEISFSYGENEERMRLAQIEQMKSIAKQLNLKEFKIGEKLQAPGANNHELGTVRMGDSPKNSILNSFNQSWVYKNLYVTDGSSFTSSGYQNPTLTILALTWRACDHIIENLNNGI